MVMLMVAILAPVVGTFIARPVSTYADIVTRAQLVDASDQALQRMTRDIQSAVPNSLRVKQDPINSNRIAVEWLNIVEGKRYRASGPGAFLDFTQPITTFNVIGQFQLALNNATCAAGSCRLVVYNTGANGGGATPADNPSAGANVYSTVAAPNCSGCLPPPGSVTITPPSTTVTLSNPGSEGQIVLGASTLFALPSPRQRLSIVDTPVTYICDTSAGVQKMTRYWGYTINSVQPTDPSVAPLSTAQSATLVEGVTACSFNYTAGSPQNNGLITIRLTLQSKRGEITTLVQQVGVDNLP